MHYISKVGLVWHCHSLKLQWKDRHAVQLTAVSLTADCGAQGCMKSGAVLTDRRYKWFEPEYWRFGDPAGGDSINYMRHASGQIYGLSGPIAKYIGRNAPILHRYANEDVSVGSWLVGLDVEHIDERRMCCDSPERCAAQVGGLPTSDCIFHGALQDAHRQPSVETSNTGDIVS